MLLSTVWPPGRFEPSMRSSRPLRLAIAERLTPHARSGRSPRRASTTLTFANVWPEHPAPDDVDGRQLRHRARAAPRGSSRRRRPSWSSAINRPSAAAPSRSNPRRPAGCRRFITISSSSSSRSAWDGGRPTFQTLGELDAGTPLLRPHHDRVGTVSLLHERPRRGDGRASVGTPLLRFVQKGRGVTSLTGEKLYEAQAIEGVVQRRVAVRLRLELLRDGRRRAGVGVPALRRAGRWRPIPTRRRSRRQVDRRLGELNIEYHGKRASGRLGPLDVVWLKPGAGEAYKMACVRAGQREGQFKPVVLQYRKDSAVLVRRLHFLLSDMPHPRLRSLQSETAAHPLQRRLPPRVGRAVRDLQLWVDVVSDAGVVGLRRVLSTGRTSPARSLDTAQRVLHQARAGHPRAHRRSGVAPRVDGVERAGARCESGGVVRDRARHSRCLGKRPPPDGGAPALAAASSTGRFATPPCSGTHSPKRSRRPPISTVVSGSPTSS